jgi:hypothetical protein
MEGTGIPKRRFRVLQQCEDAYRVHLLSFGRARVLVFQTHVKAPAGKAAPNVAKLGFKEKEE